MTEQISFGEYYDNQRDRMREAMNKGLSNQQNIEWMERYEKNRAERIRISDQEARLWQSHKFPES